MPDSRFDQNTPTRSASESGLPDVPTEASIVRRLRKRLLWTSLRQTLFKSRLRLTLIVILSLVFWFSLLWIFYDAFQFLSETEIGHSAHEQIIRTMFNVYYLALTVMLVLSSAILSYGGLYRSRETVFLLSTPMRTQRVVLHKFQESLLFSSWGFLLVGTPMLIAYGLVAGAPWYYYVMILPFLLAFAYIPVSLGTLVCMLVVRYMPTKKMAAIVSAILLVIALTMWFGWSLLGTFQGSALSRAWFQDFAGRLTFTQDQMLPSWWLCSGLLEASRNNLKPSELQHSPPAQSFLFLCLLISNAMVMRLIMLWAAGRIYREGYNQLQTSKTLRQHKKGFLLDRFVMLATGFLSRPLRLLIVKDLRTFRRDPVQWSQFLIFFGLLALYFSNIRRFEDRLSPTLDLRAWAHMISFLNLVVVGLILSAFSTRFIFPMVSLEGHRLWILNLFPIRRETILWGKFIFASTGSILACSSLILLSDLMLRIDLMMMILHQLTCVIICLGLSGIAVGLGAQMANSREQSPSKIAASFGGTLNLVLSALFIIAAVFLGAVPGHLYLLSQQDNLTGELVKHLQQGYWQELGTQASVVYSTAYAIVLGLAATLIPMRLGFLAFREMEL